MGLAPALPRRGRTDEWQLVRAASRVFVSATHLMG